MDVHWMVIVTVPILFLASLLTLFHIHTSVPVESFEWLQSNTFQVHTVHPHDPNLFTQGIVWSPDGQTLYESSGLYGRSFIQVSSLSSPLYRREALDKTFFAEDITIDPISGDLLQLTWREGRMLRWDPRTLRQKQNVSIPPTASGEGWGMTTDSRGRLFVSDGSATLTLFPSVASFASSTPSYIHVRDTNGHSISNINALAYSESDGLVYANVWKTTKIVVIDPSTGLIRRLLDISELVPESARMNSEAVANGLSFHPQTGRLWITGKYWDKMYEVQV